MSGETSQLTEPSGPRFKNSPMLFGEALQKDLPSFRASHPDKTLHQCVDDFCVNDFLLAASDSATCLGDAQDLLQLLQTLGYQASAKKGQLCRMEVSYLEYKLCLDKRTLIVTWKKPSFRSSCPRLKHCGQLWSPGFVEIAGPFY